MKSMQKRWIAVLMAVCLLLSACSSDTSVSQEFQVEQVTEHREDKGYTDYLEEYEWTVEGTELPDADAALGDIIPEGSEIISETWGFAKETVYRIVVIISADFTEDWGLCVQTLDAPYTEWENHPITVDDWVEGESCRQWTSRSNYVCEDGSVHMLLQGTDSGYIGRWSPEEGCTASKIESELISKSYFYGKSIESWSAEEGQGYYFLYSDQDDGMNFSLHTLYLDDKYQKKSGLPDISDGVVWQISMNPFSGKTYLFGSDADAVIYTDSGYYCLPEGFTIWTEGEETPVFTSPDVGYFGTDSANSVVFSSETEGYLWCANEIWQFSLEDHSIEKIWRDGDVELTFRMFSHLGLCLREDGTLLMLSESDAGEHILWEMVENTDAEDGQASEKKVLELAVMMPGSFIQKAVVEFNKQSSEYKIVIRTAKEGEMPDDFRTRIQAELASGGGPDLLSGNAFNLEVGARKGYLLDLSEYFASYEDVVLPSVWQTGQVDGRLYAVPYTCDITTLVTSEDVVGNRTGWTRQEAMECMEASGADFFAGTKDEAGLFLAMGLYSESNKDFVDWEQGKCHLNSDEAAELLKFAVEYADHESTYQDVYQRTVDGEALTCVLYLCDYFMAQLAGAMFEGKEAYIGFPAEDGESGHLISGSVFAVNKECPYAEGAVEFMEYLLSEEMQWEIAEKAVKTYGGGGFPVQNEALEYFFTCLQEDGEKVEGLSYIGDYGFQMAPLSDESIEKIRNVFLTARPLDSRTEELFTFVEEEMESYLSGDKSAQEMLDVVQNRAQLYMDEMQ